MNGWHSASLEQETGARRSRKRERSSSDETQNKQHSALVAQGAPVGGAASGAAAHVPTAMWASSSTVQHTAKRASTELPAHPGTLLSEWYGAATIEVCIDCASRGVQPNADELEAMIQAAALRLTLASDSSHGGVLTAGRSASPAEYAQQLKAQFATVLSQLHG